MSPTVERLRDLVPRGQSVQTRATVDGALTVAATAAEPLALDVDGRLGVLIEPNTMPADYRLDIQLLGTLDPAERPLLRERGRRLLHFQIEAYDRATGATIPHFNKPVRLVVDVRDLDLDLGDLNLVYYLAYRDTSHDARWIEVPLTVHQPDGLLSATVDHFSEWASGGRPDQWGLHWTPPGAAEFSGAVTYSYPIDVPAGRNGLQPDLTLAYSSRAIDGAIASPDEGPIANGWSLSEIRIVRDNVHAESTSCDPDPNDDGDFSDGGPCVPMNASDPQSDGRRMTLVHPNAFRLTLGGIGYELRPAAAADTTSDAVVRYYAKDAPGLRIHRHFDTGAPNREKIFWVVVTPDGTHYRLGYTADAESWQQAFDEHGNTTTAQIEIQGHPGLNGSGAEQATSAMAWQVDTVTDPLGNQMTYAYATSTPSQIYFNPYGGFINQGRLDVKTQKSRPAEIAYNFDTVVDLGGAPPSPTIARLAPPHATAGSRVVFDLDQSTRRIQIYHAASTTPVREIQIKTQGVQYAGPNCPEWNASTFQTTYTRRVNEIVATAGGYALPPVTFAYVDFAHYNFGGAPGAPNYHDYDCFRYDYLQRVDNGYGAYTRFTYQSDDRAVGAYDYTYNPEQLPQFGRSYYVHEVFSSDGLPVDPSAATPTARESRTRYQYGTPCYNQFGSDGMPCGDEGVPVVGGLVGFDTVTVWQYDYTPADALLGRREVAFAIADSALRGRPTVERSYNGHDVLTAETTTAYASETFAPVANPHTFKFTFVQAETRYTYAGLHPAAVAGTRTEYDYQPEFQGGAQYGNLTHVWHYADAADTDPYRHSRTTYVPNAGAAPTDPWLVNAPIHAHQYDPHSGSDSIHGTWFAYDGQPLGTPPTAGLTTRSRAYAPIACDALPQPVTGCAHAYRTHDVTTAYDAYGNPTSVTTYADAGYRATNINYSELFNQFPADARVTSTVYDNAYHLVPRSVTDAAGHTTTFDVYGFDGVPVDGYQVQPGLLKRVTQPNGVTRLYEYDPFGRLVAEYDDPADPGLGGYPYATEWEGNPLRRLRYWDNAWNHNDQYLDPLHGAPFYIAEQPRPGDFPNPGQSGDGYDYNTQTYFDGFGRALQTRQLWAEVDGEPERRDIFATTAYDALGRTVCTTTPYDLADYWARALVWPDSPYDSTPCADRAPDAAQTVHGVGGGGTLTIAPNGSASTAIADAGGRLTVRPAGQLRLEGMDAFGRLTHVDETYATFEDSFADGDGAWQPYGSGGGRTVVNGVLRLTAAPDDQFGVRRALADAGAADSAVLFDFRASDISAVSWFSLERGAWGPSYRHWGVHPKDGQLTLLTCAGTTCDYAPLLPAAADTWYRAVLRLGQASGDAFELAVWERDDPSTRAIVRLDMDNDGAWQGNNWTFVVKTSGGGPTIDLDNVTFFDVHRTRYAYDVRDNLVQVVDPTGENITAITYDGFGRKTALDDPDMGAWAYAYDAAGNLVDQLDARGVRLCAAFDDLDRPTVRWQRPDGAPCGAAPAPGDAAWLSTTTYGPITLGGGTWGAPGQPARVRWAGPDGGIDEERFRYDSAGRPTLHRRILDGQPYDLETLTFDPFDRPLDVRYPNGETVSLTYDREGIDRLSTDAGGVLADAARYNARGQLTGFDRGNGVGTTYTYASAGGNYRLQETVTAGVAGYGYGYDLIGNIHTLTSTLDLLNPGGLAPVDVQTYGYDSLNRLASAAGATSDATLLADYTESYAYDITGNVLARDGLSYVYGGGPAHAVTAVCDDSGSATLMVTVEATAPQCAGCTPSADAVEVWVNENLVDTLVLAPPEGQTVEATLNVTVGASGDDVVTFKRAAATSNGVAITALTLGGEAPARLLSVDGVGAEGVLVAALPAAFDGALHWVRGAAQRFSYDANGNMGWRQDAATAYVQTFDADNRLVRVVDLATGETTEFAYDAAGQRTRTRVLDALGAVARSVSYPFPGYEVETRVARADFYVHAGVGADGNDGSPGAPFATLGRALAEATPGDTLHVAAGEYPEAFEIAVPGVTLLGGYSEIDWLARDPWQHPTWLTGLDTTAGTPHTVAVAADGVTVDGFHLKQAVKNGTGVLVRGGGAEAALEQLYITNYSSGVQVGATAAITRLVVVSNTVGLSYFGGGEGSVRRATVVDNAEYGIRLAASSEAGIVVLAEDSVIVHNGTGAANLSLHGAALIEDFNDFYPANNARVNVLEGAGSISADPLFVDLWGRNLRLYASSPAAVGARDGGVQGAYAATVPDDAPAVRLTVESYAGWSERPLDVCPVWVDISDPQNPVSHAAGPCVPAPDYDLAVTVTLTATDMGGLARHGARVRLPAEAPAYRGPDEAGGYWGMWCYLGWAQHFYHVWPFWSTGVRQSVIAPGSDGDACPPDTINGGGHGVSGNVAVPRSLVGPVGPPRDDGGVVESGETVITRLTYFFGGQALAVRVAGDSEYPANNGLFYLHSDHLGSTSGLTYGLDDAGQPHPAAGAVVPGSAGLFLPYGEYRQRPVTHPDVTDTGFTGHRHNDDIGLVYMNARFYVAGVGRFASADTLVPEPGAAIGYNRYAYANLNPIAYSDPTGHLSQEEIETYFGYSDRNAMLDSGWLEGLVDWLWDPDTTWGDTLVFDHADSVAMLALFESTHRFSREFEGGFYGIQGASVGTRIMPEQIERVASSAGDAPELENYYRQHGYHLLPRRIGIDGLPHFDPASFNNYRTGRALGAIGTTASAIATTACLVLEPCGMVVLGPITVQTMVNGISIATTVTAVGQLLFSDEGLANRYPILLLPNAYDGTWLDRGNLNTFRPPRGQQFYE